MNKPILTLIILSLATAVSANDARNEWHNTTLPEETIKKIQDAQYHYKQCVAHELQKPLHQKQDSRHATDQIMHQCEPALAQMRTVYLAAKVPEVIADRHLKQMRTQTTRQALQTLILAEAARKSGR